MDPTQLQVDLDAVGGVLFALLGAYLLLELLLLHFWRRDLRLREARMSFLGVVSNGVATGLLIRLAMPFGVAVAAQVGAGLSPIPRLGFAPGFGMGLTALAWFYGWLVYELAYWVQHWAAHKVRLLWCMHSAHHAPRSIHMLVGTNHHFLEATFYFPLFFGLLPALCGVHPLICVAINLVDGIWGSFLHISDRIVPVGRYGWLESFMQTPSHHRVHHGKNVRYLDSNYNSITLLWDWVFGTLQPLRDDEPVEYGITREVDTGSFWDVHCREWILLAHDVRNAPCWGDRIRYLIQPPGWKPGDASATAGARKRAMREGSGS